MLRIKKVIVGTYDTKVCPPAGDHICMRRAHWRSFAALSIEVIFLSPERTRAGCPAVLDPSSWTVRGPQEHIKEIVKHVGWHTAVAGYVFDFVVCMYRGKHCQLA